VNGKLIQNSGRVDSIKQSEVMRLFYINPRGFGPEKCEKIEMLKKKIDERNIEGILFSSPDRRWNSLVTRKIKYQL